MTAQTPRSGAWIGCDVGSTAVKVVVLTASGLEVVHCAYERHGTRQADAVVRLLHALAARDPQLLATRHIIFTGSGGRALAQRAGCGYVQEVNAVALATERLHPEAGSVVDLGGQDAKIIIWQRDPATGRRRKLFSMNDKCAGGTGAVIDRIAGKLGLAAEVLTALRVTGRQIHPVAARCGVFAETDVNSLQKQGVPPEDLLASLFEAIVQQNLSVLTRGATLQPPVLLLGGPHAFLPGLAQTWRRALLTLWKERGLPHPANPAEAVSVPEEACYFAAIGAVHHAQEERSADSARETCAEEVLRLLERAAASPAPARGLPGLLADPAEEAAVRALARQGVPQGLRPREGNLQDVVIGLDAGSTSTKAVALDAGGQLLAKSYRLSAGDPLRDAQMVLADLAAQAHDAQVRMNVRALGVTGYAKDLLGAFLGADLILVETVAHTRSALHVCPQAEVIVDVGGQDIKVLILRGGRVRDFRLNSQCSAGNGYFLQSTAERFGIPLAEFAQHAFRAERCPEFNFGCAVFLEADIVNFQQLGWRPHEILAGLARVLPKNIWLYVVGEPNLARLGRCFVLQGGTQRNLAAVKAEMDFIRERAPQAAIQVHPHSGEAGAIGVALELLRLGLWKRPSRFLGLEAVGQLEAQSRQDESTRCGACPNRCPRTILESRLPGGGTRRFVVAPCEIGRGVGDSVETPARGAPADWIPAEKAERRAPDFAAQGARVAFRREPWNPSGVRAPGRHPWWLVAFPWLPGAAGRLRRDHVRIGIPRAVNLFQTAPFFLGYLHALGVAPVRLMISGTTTEELFRRGSRRGAVDNCFPSKLALAHVHDLVWRVKPDWIFFPILASLPQEVTPALGASVCPTSQATPEVVKAALTRERDLFAEQAIRYLNPVFHMAEPRLFEREMLRFWGPLLGVTRRENARAMQAGEEARQRALEEGLRDPALACLRRLARERRIGIVVLGRPYHDDPGLNHGIFRDLNRLGYAIFTVASLPRDGEFLGELFGAEIEAGAMRGPFDVSDVWRATFSANSNQKLWAAKIVARHPNLVALDVSSFRCGHDAPLHATLEEILEASGTPYFTFHEVDENRPSGAVRLRVETIDYFLREYEARVLRRVGVWDEWGTEPAPTEPSVSDSVLV